MIDKELSNYIKDYIVETIGSKIDYIIERKLDEWFKSNIEAQVDKAIKEQFKKMMVVKFE